MMKDLSSGRLYAVSLHQNGLIGLWRSGSFLLLCAQETLTIWLV
jgi:hypothetical protein